MLQKSGAILASTARLSVASLDDLPDDLLDDLLDDLNGIMPQPRLFQAPAARVASREHMSCRRVAQDTAAWDTEPLNSDARPSKLPRLEAGHDAVALSPHSRAQGNISSFSPAPSAPPISSLAAAAAAVRESPTIFRSAACSLPPPESHFTDHLIGRRQIWPKNAGGCAASCAEVAAGAMIQCRLISNARVVCIRWLQVPQMHRQPLPLPLSPPGCAGATAAELLRVRGSEVAYIACKMTKCAQFLRQRDRCRWAREIVTRVNGGQCKAVQVRHCISRSNLHTACLSSSSNHAGHSTLSDGHHPCCQGNAAACHCCPHPPFPTGASFPCVDSPTLSCSSAQFRVRSHFEKLHVMATPP